MLVTPTTSLLLVKFVTLLLRSNKLGAATVAMRSKKLLN